MGPDPASRSRPSSGGRAAPASGVLGAAGQPGWPALGIGAALSGPVARVRGWLAMEAGAGRLFPWIPVAFGIGIALYFSADHEPFLWVVCAVALGLCGLCWMARRRAMAFAILALLAALASGFAGATLRTAWVAHDVLPRSVFSARVTGTVESREVREKSERIVLRVETAELGQIGTRLSRVRLAFRKGQAPAVGARIAVKARLSPPQSPVRPGGYDFARDMYFQRLSASGFALGRHELLPAATDNRQGLALQASAALNRMREGIDARIGAAISGDAKSIASALITGRRDAISTPLNDAMYVSGLGHVLSISGYHMAVVAGLVFFLVRLALAAVPGLSSHAPIKTWAACAALAASGFYLALSGAEVATVRSFIMTAVVLAGIMLDRRAITYRTLAVAALIVLALTPEALVQPSFQMSFAATLAIVALVAGGSPRLFPSGGATLLGKAASWGGRELVALILVSLVAGLATMPAVAFHFNRVAPYGALANLLAMPVVSAWVMPAGIVALVAMPFGFDGLFWRLMEGGILWMNAVAQWVAALPGAVGPVGAFDAGALALASLGLIVICLLHSPLRWAGAGFIAMACVIAARAPQADLYVAQDGRSLAVRAADGRLRQMSDGKNPFAQRSWLQADGDTRPERDASLGEGVRCDGAGCVAALRGGGLVALVKNVRAFDDDCQKAAVIVTRIAPPVTCAAAVIGPDELAAFGAITLRREEGLATDAGFAVASARSPAQNRPWQSRPWQGGLWQGGTWQPRPPTRSAGAGGGDFETEPSSVAALRIRNGRLIALDQPQPQSTPERKSGSGTGGAPTLSGPSGDTPSDEDSASGFLDDSPD